MKSPEVSRYNKIALDIAYRIQNNELLEGMKIKGRSQLSGEYNVSPETIRRAINLLHEMQVVEVVEKSGITIISKKNALKFIKTFTMQSDLTRVQQDFYRLFEERKKIDDEIGKKLVEMYDISTKLKHKEEIPYFHCDIPNNSHLIGKTLKESHFYQQTNATVIAINRQDILSISIGPDFIFKNCDIIIFICQSDDYNKTIQYIKNLT